MIKLSKMLKRWVRSNMASQISQWNVIENLIINKLGITILPATISELLNDDVKMIQLENANTEWELGVVWKKISV